MRHFFRVMKTDLLYKIFRESSGISTDTRSLSKNQMFFALWGESYNGNKFAADAIERGARCAVIDDPLLETENTILVDDTLFELQALAGHYRKELNIPVIAVTGSNGKTTTKELLAAILSKKYKVHYTKGNLNNHIGVPLTILSAPEDTQIMIVEMGASHIGEIRTLCLIARPDYGLITNISPAHIEGFGTFEGVVKAKTELYEHLRKVNGIAFYNNNDTLLSEKIFKMVNRAVPLSDPTGIDLILEEIPSDLYLNIKLTYLNESFELHTNLFGKYNIENVRAAVAIGLFLGVGMEEIVDAVNGYVPANNRSQVMKSKSNTVICDAYNANPASMSNAIDSFSSVENSHKVIILGDMLELGDKSDEEHLKLIEKLRKLNNTKVYLVGPVFMKNGEGTGLKVFSNIDNLAESLKKDPPANSFILVKGSRGMKLEKIYELL